MQQSAELVSLARNPVPSGAVTGFFAGYDGAAMRYARWEPTRSPHRGTVCCFTGRSEFIERYFETIADLRRRGFTVAVMDWRGQGGSNRALSNPRKGHIRNYDEYDRDLACFMDQVVLPHCPAPYIALGHSMGGHLLLREAAYPDSPFERIVVTAPMLEFHPLRVGAPDWVARGYATVATLLGFGSSYVRGGGDDFQEGVVFEGNALTSDRERFERSLALAKAAPHLTIGSATISWLHASYKSMAMLNDPSYPARVKVPVLLFSAGADTIVLPRANEDFAARLKVGQGVVLATAKHEILQENDEIRAHFWAAFDAYLGIEARAA
jgi:lysophospholipase